MIELSPLVNKTVEFAYRGARLTFDLSHGLFSSFAIDTGTRLLLKEIAHDEVALGARSILDAGCGTGIIGVSLAASTPRARVVMRDRDLLACAFSERNCWRNGIGVVRSTLEGEAEPPIRRRTPKHKTLSERQETVTVGPGLLGEHDPLGPYDLVVSNLPAKAGPKILSAFIHECETSLVSPGGRLAFVIVNTLADQADLWSAESGLRLVRKAVAKSHTVFILEKEAQSGSGRTLPQGSLSLPMSGRVESVSSYERSSGQRSVGRYRLPVKGYWGLPEFDTNSYASELAVEGLEKAAAGSLVREMLVVEPGVGIPALWAARTLGPTRFSIMSRDILALAATGSNLSGMGISGERFRPISWLDADSLTTPCFDSILIFPEAIPEYDFMAPYWTLAASTAKSGAGVVIVSTPTITGRFAKLRPEGFRILSERKKKGYSALIVIKS